MPRRARSARPGETTAQTFARHYEAPTPDGAALRKAVEIAKADSVIFVVDLGPGLTLQTVYGSDAVAVDDPKAAIAAYDKLLEIARK